MFSDQFYEKRLSVRERNMKLLFETDTHIAIKERVTCIITMETLSFSYNKEIKQKSKH